MSEAKEEAPKKKGGKLPVIIAVAVALAGGGFFMMKGKGKEEKGPKKVELGEPVVLKEILVNLADGDTYLKTEIALQFDKAFKAEEVEKNAPIINNAIILVLKTKKPSELKDLDGLRKLQRQIAEKVNEALPEKEGEHADKDSDKEKKSSKKKKKHSDEEATSEEDPPEESEFDSETGPVRKVYFSSFATQ